MVSGNTEIVQRYKNGPLSAYTDIKRVNLTVTTQERRVDNWNDGKWAKHKNPVKRNVGVFFYWWNKKQIDFSLKTEISLLWKCFLRSSINLILNPVWLELFEDICHGYVRHNFYYVDSNSSCLMGTFNFLT